MKMSAFLFLAACLVNAEEFNRTIEKSLPMPPNGILDVCNINGSIRIEPGGGSEVRFSIREHIEAPSREKMDGVKRGTDVVFNQDGNRVKAGVKGPWSDVPCGEKSSGRRRWESGRGIEIVHEMTIQAPRDVRFEISTVNGGVELKDSRGDYQLKTVNGSVKLTDAEGSGSVTTVNGSVTAVYRNNPRSDSQFKTVNGKVELYLQPGLNAEFHMKTVNGSAYTDFDMTPIFTEFTTRSTNSNTPGKIVYKRGNAIALRAGNGGAKLTAETVNGSVLLHSLAKGRP